MLSPAILPPQTLGDLTLMDRLIAERLQSDIALVRTVAQYIIAAGGKRLRPVVLLLMARAAGFEAAPADPAPHHVLLAAVVECIHTATLLHDDVVDESTLRRGRATANAAFGNPASVLVGDFLYSRAFQMMVATQRLDVMQLLADATNTIAEGEVLQLMHCHDPDIDEARYVQVIQYKTARLFEAAAQAGVLISPSAPACVQAAADYGRHLGTAFQLIDDVLDYSGVASQIGKNVGDDLREGKVTLPLIHVLREGSAAERHQVRQAIERGTTDDFPAIVAALTRTRALEHTRQRAHAEAQAARAALQALPDSPYRDALALLAEQSVSRDR